MDGDHIIEVPDEDFYLTDAITDHAVTMINDAAGTSPFFLYLAYTAPHWPLHALEEDIARYERTFRAGWDTIRAGRHERLRDAGILDPRWRISALDPDSFPFSESQFPEWEAMRMAVYAAQIDRMDQGIGKVVDALRRHNVLDDTLLLVCSDNGGCSELLEEEAEPEGASRYERPLVGGKPMRVGNVPDLTPGGADTFMSYDLPWANVSNSPFRRFKSWVHEGGISTPLVVHWPRHIKEPGLRHAPVHFVDMLPTFAEIAGASVPSERDGVELIPLEGESIAASFSQNRWRRSAPLWFEHEGNRALREESWKLVARHTGQWELYNMEDDRTELHDLADEEPERVARMAAEWDDTARRVGVRPSFNPIWDGVAGWHRDRAIELKDRMTVMPS
jgi:arylsulfatase A-like enzyme